LKSYLVGFLFVVLFGLSDPSATLAQSTALPTPSPSPQASAPSTPPASAPAPSQGSATAPTSPPAQAMTSGVFTIESTALAYQALSEEARVISERLNSATREHVVFVGTSGDVNAILLLRAYMNQAGTIQGRLDRDTARLQTFGCAKKKGAAPRKPTLTPSPISLSALAPQSFSDIVTALQTAAAIAQVNETVVTGTGSIGDAALITEVFSSNETTRRA
jgi:hypothetical protein